ncbi:MAG: peroxiredoxin [Lentisphaerae bacterium RIFOXYA12_FULL_48_11]|nr:MAG: peroxiredoxin [Lentisphaerae bacterium RIFOXYA12_FULL_48_11]
MAAGLSVGAEAPDFSAKATGSRTIKLSELKGKWIVLYFYPKADTPGCTKESCSLRDGYDAIKAAGAVILGVSLDSVENQEKFKSKYTFQFDLLSDSDKKISKAYGVLAVGGLFSQRKTFIIRPDGKIAYIFEKVDVGRHNEEVLAVLENLAKK